MLQDASETLLIEINFLCSMKGYCLRNPSPEPPWGIQSVWSTYSKLLSVRKMQPSKKKNVEYSEAFCRPSAVQKTSAEIINEARTALRTLRTQRPFTPREEQRKLFGSASSRTPENRPPSAFSLHASSFESVEARPVSCARLSPLEHKPKLRSSPRNNEEHHISPPKPPVDSEEVRKISNARAHLFRAASYGNLLPDKMLLPNESKMLNFEDHATMYDVSGSSDESCSQNLNVQMTIKDECLPLTYKEHQNKIVGEEVCSQMIDVSSPSQCNSESDKVNGQKSPLPCVDNIEWTKSAAKSENNFEANETEEEENYWNTKILPILHELETDDNVESLCHACTVLYRTLEEGNMLDKRFKRRSLFLKTLYKLVDIASDPLGLKLAKIILGLKVSGKNLLNVCKLVFKISRNEKNDSIIQNDQILDSLLEILRVEDLQANTEAFLYCMGAMKFISGNARLINEMVNKGTVEILLQLMKEINEINDNDARFSSSGHLLVPLTATLRNLVDLPQSRCKLMDSEAIPDLCLMLEKRMNDKDICTNVARIFSKLSSFNDCCTALAGCSRCYVLFLALLNKHPKKQDLVIRIIFILGNLTAKNNQAREQFFEMQGSINTLIALFQTNCEADSNSKLWKGDGKLKNLKHPSEAEDVLIKLIRVIANLSIHPSVGASLATNHHIVTFLITVLEYKSVDECEELVINATATISNLSFYKVKNSVIEEKKLYIAELYKFIIALLDARHQDVCFSACGVLLNLTVDKSRCSILNEEGGIKKLIDCLRDFGPTDWQLACLICKTLWNYSENVTRSKPCFEDDESNTLLVLLASYLDEELALDYNFDNDLRDYHKLYWETEFKPVAEKLLQRIQN
ncbi:armadillo repeat-containing protein 2 isoform X2 [Rhineura floridana]|uniref:armadillo repeat-containing protein 2 isoform X2 n=1 Tax=Rhineura floridana TaxID=261503 RepID=UPI002AC84020|nr:armadillo repeat-containing protein 2 isoform X2 [Rhineura floridana]